MSTETIRATVLGILASIAPETDAASLDPQANLREELDLDSMDWLRFVQAVHEETGVEIPEREYRRLRSLQDCLQWLERAIGTTRAGAQSHEHHR